MNSLGQFKISFENFGRLNEVKFESLQQEFEAQIRNLEVQYIQSLTTDMDVLKNKV